MAGSSKRERQLAREHYLRQQQRRAQVAARRRRVQQITAVVVAVVLVVGGVAVLANLLGNDDSSTAASNPGSSDKASPSTSPSVSPSASPSDSSSAAAGECVYTKGSEKASKPVGLPSYDKAKAPTYKQPFTATLKTNMGDVVIKLAADKAPCTANSFRHLVTSKFYDSTPCHRLTTEGIFVLQCGDPTGKGSGGPGYGFGVENAPKDFKYPPGTVAMARTSDPNSNGSQFFLVYKDTQLQDPNGYTIFGTIIKGLDVVETIAKTGTSNGSGDGAPKDKVTIESATIGKA